MEERDGNVRKQTRKASGIKRLRMMYTIIRNTFEDKLIFQFLIGYLLSALIIQHVEPEIHTYGDSLWYLFAASTTVGFGDVTAVTLIGRLLTVYVTLSGILVVAFVPAVMMNYYQEVMQARKNETITEFFDALEHLPELSKEELEDISNQIKKFR